MHDLYVEEETTAAVTDVKDYIAQKLSSVRLYVIQIQYKYMMLYEMNMTLGF